MFILIDNEIFIFHRMPEDEIAEKISCELCHFRSCSMNSFCSKLRRLGLINDASFMRFSKINSLYLSKYYGKFSSEF